MKSAKNVCFRDSPCIGAWVIYAVSINCRIICALYTCLWGPNFVPELRFYSLVYTRLMIIERLHSGLQSCLGKFFGLINLLAPWQSIFILCPIFRGLWSDVHWRCRYRQPKVRTCSAGWIGVVFLPLNLQMCAYPECEASWSPSLLQNPR